MIGRRNFVAFASTLLLCASALEVWAQVATGPVEIDSDWQMQQIGKVKGNGDKISKTSYKASGWYAATVPGTVLATLVNNHVYPEPLYGENNRPDKIPESLARTSYWYRTTQPIPKNYAGRKVWLNFEGINYAAEVWVNGAQVGTIRGAFIRGRFDITSLLIAAKPVTIAVLVAPQPHPGDPIEHTQRNGLGKNGGITAIDGPTFLSTIGWDWLPGIRDRDTGIWQGVFLSSTGPVALTDPLVTTDLPLPLTDKADINVETQAENLTADVQRGILRGVIEGGPAPIAFEQPVEIPAHSKQMVRLDPVHVQQPRLWWPNGYGPQNLYKLRLSFVPQGARQAVSDAQDVSFGIRKITYAVPGSDNLTISVNGVPIFIRGGDWGLDEAMKRIPRERLEAQIRMHRIANLNMIRNWVGQSTSEAFYELCDKYGILVWDEFFQPNPHDGPDPEDLPTYMANVRDKVIRFRNHPSIALWCARNEGRPPANIDAALQPLLAEVNPDRLYQPSSTSGRGVKSGGPYYWREPRAFYAVDAPFKTETGSMSVPTLESIHGMMPQKDWEVINDDWAEHDMAKGHEAGDRYPAVIAARYGKIANLADFARKGQLANYEAFRAMYEGRNAALFAPATGVITWMSHPAQPSFVWQLYHYDLEPNSALFAVKKAGEPVHAQFNEATGELEVINNTALPIAGDTLQTTVLSLEGQVIQQQKIGVAVPASREAGFGILTFPDPTQLAFLKLELRDSAGTLVSDNFYWHGPAAHPDNLTDLNLLPPVTLQPTIARSDADGKTLITVTLRNPSNKIALMAHIQLRRHDGERILPVFYSDNYISLLPGESHTLTIEAADEDLHGQDAMVVVDGWNVTVDPVSSPGVAISPNVEAQVEHWPVTGLPFAPAHPSAPSPSPQPTRTAH